MVSASKRKSLPPLPESPDPLHARAPEDDLVLDRIDSFIARWSAATGSEPVAACQGLAPGDVLSNRCQAYLDANDKAAEQWRLEGRLRRFESRY